MYTETIAQTQQDAQDEYIPAAFLDYQRLEDITGDMIARYSGTENITAVMERGLGIAHEVEINNTPEWESVAGRPELSGYHMATANGYHIRKAQRGGRNWNSPAAYHVLTCGCRSYQYDSGTATITKPAKAPRHQYDPATTSQKLCKHIAAYGIVQRDNQKQAEAADALAAEFFTPAEQPEAVETVTLSAIINERGRVLYTLAGAEVLESQLLGIGIATPAAGHSLQVERHTLAMETRTYNGIMQGKKVLRLWAVK